jgi:hypothetical protein
VSVYINEWTIVRNDIHRMGYGWNNLQATVTEKLLCVISGFRRDVDEICALLGHYSALSGSSVPPFRDNLSVPSSRVKKSDFFNLEDGTDRLSRNAGNYQSTLRKIPEEQRPQSCIKLHIFMGQKPRESPVILHYVKHNTTANKRHSLRNCRKSIHWMALELLPPRKHCICNSHGRIVHDKGLPCTTTCDF